jgi:UbiD family decarboxylase
MIKLRDCKTFRDYLDKLEQEQLLLRVKKELSPKHELAAGIRKISDIDGPALLFENIKGFQGWRVAGGLYATKRLFAAAIECEPDDRKLYERCIDIQLNKKPIKPKRVSSGPVKEIILKGKDADLTKMPNMTWCEKDSGPYIIPVTIAKHPVTGVQNLTIERREVRGKYECGVDTEPPMHTGMIWLAYGEKGEGMPVAGVLSAPPEVAIGSQFKPLLGVDEMEIAGAIRGEPIEIVKCETIDVDVPANAEIIIEGICRPKETYEDGPFGEYGGDYWSTNGARGDQCFIMDVTAITMRKDPIYSGFLTGMPMTENQWLRKYVTAAEAYRIIRELPPYADYIKGIDVVNEGGLVTMVVSIHKWSEGAPAAIIYELLSAARKLLISLCIVVDEDVDVYNFQRSFVPVQRGSYHVMEISIYLVA